jgi:chorismate mutase/prephenate dehydratase
MDLQDLREKIDIIDDELTRLFGERMDISAEIARYKRENNIPVYDKEREQQKLRDLSGKVKTEYADYAAELYSLLFKLSRAIQSES